MSATVIHERTVLFNGRLNELYITRTFLGGLMMIPATSDEPANITIRTMNMDDVRELITTAGNYLKTMQKRVNLTFIGCRFTPLLMQEFLPPFMGTLNFTTCHINSDWFPLLERYDIQELIIAANRDHIDDRSFLHLIPIFRKTRQLHVTSAELTDASIPIIIKLFQEARREDPPALSGMTNVSLHGNRFTPEGYEQLRRAAITYEVHRFDDTDLNTEENAAIRAHLALHGMRRLGIFGKDGDGRIRVGAFESMREPGTRARN